MYQPIEFKDYLQTIDCDLCNNTRYIDKTDAEGLLYVIRCTCQNKRKIQKGTENLSGLLEEFNKMTLDSFIRKRKIGR